MITFLVLLLYQTTYVGSSETPSPFSYLLQPTDRSYLGSSPQDLHVFVTSRDDARLSITLPDQSPGGVLFHESVVLSRNNSWAWRQTLHLNGSLLNTAISYGIRLTSSKPIIAYVLSYTAHGGTCLTAYNALVLTPADTCFTLGMYLCRYCPSEPWAPFYVISAWDKPVNYTVYRYSTDAEVPTPFESGSLEAYHSVTRADRGLDVLIGLRINTTAPVSVFAGNRRGAVLPFPSALYSRREYAKPLLQQIAPDPGHGSEYVVGPLPAAVGYSPRYAILVAFLYDDTTLTLIEHPDADGRPTLARTNAACSLSALTGRTIVKCAAGGGRGGYVLLEQSSCWLPLVLTCSRPCSPMLLKQAEISAFQQPSGYMSLVAPPAKLRQPLRIFIPGHLASDSVDLTYVIIAVADEQATRATIDGRSVSEYQQLGSCNVSNVDRWSTAVCSVPYGVHVIGHARPDVIMAVHVHGYSLKLQTGKIYSNSYGFPAYYPDQALLEATQTSGILEPSAVNPTAGLDTSKISTDHAQSGVSILVAVNLLFSVVLVICMSGLIFLAIQFTRKFRSERRMSIMPDPCTPTSHTYLLPRSTTGNDHSRCCQDNGSHRNAADLENTYCYCDLAPSRPALVHGTENDDQTDA